MRPRTWLFAAYVLLLLASHVVRLFQPDPPRADSERRTAALTLTRQSEEIVVAYRDLGRADAPAIVLLHGSPGRGENFASIEEQLAERMRVLVPDLPGFGRSQRWIDDYSIAAHAEAVVALLDSLGIEEAHGLGFSMGGGVLLEVSRLAPGLLRSVTLLSSIGVQEFELLGDYALNHLVHAGQLVLVVAASEFVPHFGWLDRFPLNRPYARNFYDTDQRPLRGILASLDLPALILHGRSDGLVPPAAAREHHRLLPQSEIVWLDDGHFALFRQGPRVAGVVLDFVERVEAGTAVTRASAPLPRRRAAEAPATEPPSWRSPFAIAVFGVLVFLASMVSEDLTCIGVGLLIARGQVEPPVGIAACVLGLWLGDLLLFAVGRLGRGRVERWLARRRHERLAAPVEGKLLGVGSWAIVASRFLPGARLPLYVGAGAAGFPFLRFAALLLLAGVVWTPVLVGAAAWAGDAAMTRIELLHDYALATLLALIAVLLLATRVLPRLASHRGRRLLYGRWQRLRRWEFWPTWALYPPVVLRIALLALRHRSLRLVTAVNPGIAGGGLVGESKWEILAPIQAAMPDAVARTARVGHPRDPVAAARAAVEELGLSFPVVLKPDEGERGRGVSIVRRESDLPDVATALAREFLVQEYVPGIEFGLFYIRRPEASRGSIFSITEKRMIDVVGNGRHTLERLILDDPRAVCLAERHFERHARSLSRVPGVGEVVTLTELGTHSRGALFLDGALLGSEALGSRLDAVSRALPGFHFGRYDVRCPDVETLRRGSFRVVELNGLTSEATHMYDPRYGLRDAYRILFRQWKLAFELAEANRRAGARPAGWHELRALFGRRASR